MINYTFTREEYAKPAKQSLKLTAAEAGLKYVKK